MAFKKMITAVDTHAGEPMYLIPQIHSRKDSGWVIYGRCKDVTGNEKGLLYTKLGIPPFMQGGF
ncbi:MAG: hypothetical protein PVH37_26230 [Desulfobacterales bacterium]|jgi:hypothetical protein